MIGNNFTPLITKQQPKQAVSAFSNEKPAGDAQHAEDTKKISSFLLHLQKAIANKKGSRHLMHSLLAGHPKAATGKNDKADGNTDPSLDPTDPATQDDLTNALKSLKSILQQSLQGADPAVQTDIQKAISDIDKLQESLIIAQGNVAPPTPGTAPDVTQGAPTNPAPDIISSQGAPTNPATDANPSQGVPTNPATDANPSQGTPTSQATDTVPPQDDPTNPTPDSIAPQDEALLKAALEQLSQIGQNTEAKAKMMGEVHHLIQDVSPQTQEILKAALNNLQPLLHNAGTKANMMGEIRHLIKEASPQTLEALKTTLAKLQPATKESDTISQQGIKIFTPKTNKTLEKALDSTDPASQPTDADKNPLPPAENSIKNPLPLAVKDVALKQAQEQLQKVLEKLPPEAQTAMNEVLVKIQNIAEGKPEKPLGKSIQQIQLEVSFDQQPASTPENILPLPVPPPHDGAGTSETTIAPPAFSFTALDASHRISVEGNKGGSGFPGQEAGSGDSSIDSPHDQVVSAAKMSLEAGKKEIAIKLKPVELGEVRMTLTSNAQNDVSVKLITETKEAKDALEKNITHLVRSMESSGLRIGKITVIEAGSSNFDSNNSQSNNQPGDSQNGLQNFSQSQQNPHHSHTPNPLLDLGFNQSNSFTDGGSSQAGDEASSTIPFDTDVEGEEVLDTAGAREPGSVDIRA